MSQRLVQLIAETSGSKKDFALKTGISQPLVSHLTAGRNNPGLDVLQKIMQAYPDIDPEWLIMGKGTMKRGRQDFLIERLSKMQQEVEQKILSAQYELHQAIKSIQQMQMLTKGDSGTVGDPVILG